MKKILILFVAVILSITVFSQQEFTSSKVIYTNPFPNSIYNNPETSITIGLDIDGEVIVSEDFTVELKDDTGIAISGLLKLKMESGKLIFQPYSLLIEGKEYEFIVMYQNEKIHTFSFTVDNHNPTYVPSIFNELTNDVVLPPLSESDITKANAYLNNYNLPADFPAFDIINSNNPGDGYYIIARVSQNPTIPLYQIIMDTLGFPVYYRKANTGEQFYNLVLQETGLFTYFNGTQAKFLSMNSSFYIQAAYEAKNGYVADGHDLLLLDDDSYWLMIYDERIVDMSVIVPGGQPEAAVIGLVIQHIDSAGDVLFEWSSWDHMQITDADPNLVNLIALGIDYVHGNGLDIDDDGNLLISSRNLSEITKVNVNTGQIIWRFGGTQNEFNFIDDSLMFSAQHHIVNMGDNNYSLYDNGNVRSTPFSRGMIYELNTDNMTASIVKDNNHWDSLVFSPFMGGYYQGPQQESVLGWSFNNKRYVMTEFDSIGNIQLGIRSVDTGGMISYRVQKSIWETDAISFDQSEYYIAEADVGETAFKTIDFTNNLDVAFALNGFHSSDDSFTLVDELPISLLPGQTVSLIIAFNPQEEKAYTTAISMYTDNGLSRLAKQFRINTAIVTSMDNHKLKNEISVFPNPATNSTMIVSKTNSNIQSIQLYNMQGKRLLFEEDIESSQYKLDLSAFNKAIYLLKVETKEGISSQRLIIY